MFTGIVVDTAAVERTDTSALLRLRIAPSAPLPEQVQKGSSVACAGVCLTVTECDGNSFTVDVSPETATCTTAGIWTKDFRVNVEYALRAGDPLDGHLVTGHVDAVAEILGLDENDEGQRLRIALPDGLGPCIARKGSITVDGVSLTVNALDGEGFSVALIPHTAHNTTLGALREGDRVNLEADLLARYVAQALERRDVGEGR